MAKSELLKYAKKITKKSIYTSGRGTSAAGLTIAVVKINDRFVAQAGVLPLCNNGFAMIDEFDKMNKDDRSAMHEAMEQQTASVAKAGIVLTLPTKTTILAAANPKYGAYDPDSTLRDNVDIPVPLLSRFDLIWLIRDTVNVTEDMMKATHIIDSFESTSTGKKECSLSEELLKKLLNLARQQSPRINDDVKNEIIKIYNQMRAVSSNDELPVGVRQLEALIRLSYALAKLRLKDFVELDDVLTVKSLIESMYNSFNLTMNSGNRQTILTGTTRQTKQQLADKIWSECEDENGSVNIIEFMKKLIENGFEPMEAKKMFGNWERFNQIRLNSDGTYRKA
jgi:replicative DNA helicase Mcm